MYDFWIAVAAREYRVARANAAVDGTEEEQVEVARAYNKLCWMIDAETHGWNPNDYRPE